MTDADKRAQKAMLLLDCQEAEQELVELEEKAHRIGDSLSDVARWLKSVANPGTQTGVKVITRKDIATNDIVYRAAMNFDEALMLDEQIKIARDKVGDLQKRKTALGLK